MSVSLLEVIEAGGYDLTTKEDAIWLTIQEPVEKSGTGVFIRKNGKNVELTADEVKAQWPNSDVTIQNYETNEVYSGNITHNLTTMADKAGLYYPLWLPEEKQLYVAKDLILPLTRGLKKLRDNPAGFKKYNPDNGWGNYYGLVRLVEDYLTACKEYPTAEIGVSR